MPCGDGTGPFGLGPGVGAGRGGWYSGWGCHRGFAYVPYGPFPRGYCHPWSVTPEEEKAFLERRAEWLDKEKDWILQRMKDLEGAKKSE